MEFDVTTDTFDGKVLKASTPVLVDFWAEWCMPCKMVEPVLKEIAGEYEGRLDVARVNVDEEGDLAMQFNVVSIPTLLLFKGGAVVEQQVGAAPKEMILSAVNPHLDQG